MFSEGMVMVLFQEGTTEGAARELVASFGLSVMGEWQPDIYMLKVPVPVGQESYWVARFNQRDDLVADAYLNPVRIFL